MSKMFIKSKMYIFNSRFFWNSTPNLSDFQKMMHKLKSCKKGSSTPIFTKNSNIYIYCNGSQKSNMHFLHVAYYTKYNIYLRSILTATQRTFIAVFKSSSLSEEGAILIYELDGSL